MNMTFEELNEKMYQAVIIGDLDTVKNCILEGADINYRYGTILRDGAEYGHVNMIEYALSLGMNVDNSAGVPLRNAAGKGHLEVVKCLVENGANIDICDNHPLFLAVIQAHIEIVKYLISKGADIDTKDKRHHILEASISNYNNDRKKHKKMIDFVFSLFTEEKILEKQEKLIVKAMECDYPQIIHYLLSLNPSSELISRLFVLAAQEKSSQEIIDLILTYHPNINYKLTEENEEPSIYSRNHALSYFASHGNTQMVQYLIDKNVDIEIQEIALRWAIWSNKKEVVKAFLENSIDINTYDMIEPNYNPLAIALNEDHRDMVVFLLEHGAKIEKNKEMIYNKIINNDSEELLSVFVNHGMELDNIFINKVNQSNDSPNIKRYVNKMMLVKQLHQDLAMNSNNENKVKL